MHPVGPTEIAVVTRLPKPEILREKLSEQTRTPMFFNEARVKPWDAQEVAMHCDYCGKIAYGPRHLMKEAMAEHARLYHPEQGNQMRLWYPRA
jgi:hypothetical protein